MHFLKNHTRMQTRIGKVYTRFQTKTAQKPLPFGAAHTFEANIREWPPLPRDYLPKKWSRSLTRGGRLRGSNYSNLTWKTLVFWIGGFLWEAVCY